MITETENSIITQLLSENEEFQRLYEEHKDLEEKVMELVGHKYLTAEQELELARLKKVKLAGKDRMMKIMEGARQSV